MNDIFGQQIEPPDVPRKYILDALIEVRVFENRGECSLESAKLWRSKLDGWLKKMTELRIVRKLNKGNNINGCVIMLY